LQQRYEQLKAAANTPGASIPGKQVQGKGVRNRKRKGSVSATATKRNRK
jgi:hypothetical protein